MPFKNKPTAFSFSLSALGSDTKVVLVDGNVLWLDVGENDGNFTLVVKGGDDRTNFDVTLHTSTNVAELHDEPIECYFPYAEITVTDTSGASNEILGVVRPFDNSTLDGLLDVDADSPSDNNILTYNGATERWTAGSSLADISYIDFDLTAAPAGIEGRINWNDEDKTLEIGMSGTAVRLQVGQEMLIRAKNTSGGLILNGSPVYISGAIGNNPTISPATATDHTIANATIAVATEDIPDGHFGYSTTFGVVRNIDTTIVANEGDHVYLGTVAGSLLASLPIQPDSQVMIGCVLRKHATEGKLFVSIKPRPNIEELSNIYIAAVSDKQLLQYDSANGRWENVSDLEIQGTGKIGDILGGDYSEFEADGTLVFYGDATVWDDLRVPLSSTRINPVINKPDFIIFRDGVYAFGFDDADDESVNFIAQFPHSWREGTIIYPHIHWGIATAGSGVGVENVKWGLEYTLANLSGDTFPASVTIYSSIIDVQNGNQYESFKTAIGAGIDMTGKTISCIIIGRLFRDTSVANDFAPDAYGFEFDIHYEKDTIGSRQYDDIK